MKPIFKKHGALIIYAITAIAIPTSALLLKDTEHENVWLYILAAGIMLASAFEVYSKYQDKNKH